MGTENTYFASLPQEELSQELMKVIDQWNNDTERYGLKNLWQRSHRMYYGRHWKVDHWGRDSAILKVGRQGELNAVTVNHYRNLIRHILVLTTNNKLDYEVRALNSDSQSLTEARLGSNILEYYLQEKRLRRYHRNAAEHALVFGKGFMHMGWDPTLGKPIGVKENIDEATGESYGQQIQYEGDISVHNPSPWDVYTDPFLEDYSKRDWEIVRLFKNKYDLAKRYPQQETEILEAKTLNDLDRIRRNKLDYFDTPMIPVYYFYHRKTESMPNGRMMIFVTGDTAVYDGPIPYDTLPTFRIVPGEIFHTTEGYTEAFDLMGPQEVQDILHSTVFTNQSSFGTQRILFPKGCNLEAVQLAQGMVGLQYNPQAGKPEPLQLLSTPPEIFKYMEVMNKEMELISGVNSVARGNPEHSLKSGVALGLVQSMAIQFASIFQESYAELFEDSGTFLLKLLKDFASTPRMIAMAGKHNRGHMIEFTRDNIQNVDRVVVSIGNPLSKTTAGRSEMAKELMNSGLVKNAQEYITVIQTGNIDPLLEAPQSQVDLVRKENEMMQEGNTPEAVVLDAHIMHMREHATLINNPEVRANEQLTQIALAHIQQHIDLYKKQSIDPVDSQILSMVTGEPPAPMPPPMPIPPQEGGEQINPEALPEQEPAPEPGDIPEDLPIPPTATV